MTRLLIRHGAAVGNLEGRYLGCRTDEPLCPEGIAALRALRLPPVPRVFSSPMRRCLETAALLFPGVTPEIVEDFRECDFGAFEGKNYGELNGDPAYQRWVDSFGTLPFPGGESRADFSARCVRAYAALPEGDCALVVHGGVIMAIMEAYARPGGGYYDFQVTCGGGYALREDGRYRRLPFRDTQHPDYI